MNETTKKAYQNWLTEQDWTYFFTGTFREEGYTVNSARRALERYFRIRQNKPEFAFFCIETGALYGRVHTHGLLRYPEKGLFHPSEPIWNGWFERYGRSRLEIPESQEAVTGYCTKYCTKHLKDETYIFL